MTRFFTRRIFVLVGLTAVGGCATTPSLNEVQAFGKASKQLSDSSREAFELVGATRIERQIYTVAADPQSGPTDDTFRGLIPAQQLVLRIELLERLADYASALEALAVADFNEEVNAASTELRGSLLGLSQTYEKASGESLGVEDAINVVSTAVNAIGKGVIEAKRRAAIREIILQVDPAIQKAATLVASELGAQSELADYVAANVNEVYGQMLQAYNTERVAPTSTFQQRLAALQLIHARHDAAQAVPAFFESVSGGAASIARAHAALARAVSRNAFSSDEIVRTVTELADFAKDVQKYHKSLNE